MLSELVKEPIFVKDFDDVIRVADILGSVGIQIFSSPETRLKFLKNGHDVKNNYLICDGNAGFRIQSHYLGDGIPVDEIEKKVNQILGRNIQVPEIPQMTEKLIEKFFKEFCKKTKRSGGVLVHASIGEWHKYLAENLEQTLKRAKYEGDDKAA